MSPIKGPLPLHPALSRVPALVLRRARHQSLPRRGPAPTHRLASKGAFPPLFQWLKLADVPTSPTEPPLAGTGSRSGHRRRAAGVPSRRQPLSSPRQEESGQGDPQAASSPRPADPGRRLAGIWPEPRRPPSPRGYIAR
jgi:hypothetical protein